MNQQNTLCRRPTQDLRLQPQVILGHKRVCHRVAIHRPKDQLDLDHNQWYQVSSQSVHNNQVDHPLVVVEELHFLLQLCLSHLEALECKVSTLLRYQ